MQDIVKENFSSTTPTFVWATPPFRSRLLLNRAAARKTTKEPVNFLIVAVINKAKNPKVV